MHNNESSLHDICLYANAVINISLKTFFFFYGGKGSWRQNCLGPIKVIRWPWLAQDHSARKGQNKQGQAGPGKPDIPFD